MCVDCKTQFAAAAPPLLCSKCCCCPCLQFLVGLIIAPCGLLWTGAVTHIFYQPLEDIRALFSCCILLFLLSTYTLATTASLVLHDWLVAPRLRHVDEGEVAWRTHDMMFFTVSTAVGRLVQPLVLRAVALMSGC